MPSSSPSHEGSGASIGLQLAPINLVDRSSGKTLTITLWETEEAMRNGEEAANRIRTDKAAASGGKIVSVEHYEVAAAELR